MPSFFSCWKTGGFHDTRGTLFFEIVRFANIIRPQYLFLENVKGLLNHDKGNTFETILRTLDELGYDAEWQVLNSKDFGVPQNRERVFIIGHLRGGGTRKVFPVGESSELYYGREETEQVHAMCLTGKGQSNWTGTFVRPVLTHDRENKRQNGRRIKEPDEPMFTLTGQDRHGIAIKEATTKGYDTAYPGDSINYSVPNSKTRRGRVGKGLANTLDTTSQQGVLTDEYRIRKLTPKECWRLQGFPDWAFEKAASINSDSQLYKQAGNSVTVNVIYEIAKKLEVNAD